MAIKISSCPEFWKDIKHLFKVFKSQQYCPTVEEETFKQLDTHAKVEAIPTARVIATAIVNAAKGRLLDSIADKYDVQPFLTEGWEIRKMRFAIDNKGKQGGLRIIFCLDQNLENLILVLIKRKADCANEKELRKDFLKRISQFLKA